MTERVPRGETYASGVLIERERQDGIRSGRTTLLFRRWSRRRVTVGKVYRTAAGRLAVDGITVVRPAEITGGTPSGPGTRRRPR